MYEKDLKNQVVLRINDKDMDFLRMISEYRETSISRVIRSIIGDYRRSLEYEVKEHDK